MTAILLPLPLIAAFVAGFLAFAFRRGADGRWISLLGSALHLAAGIALLVVVMRDGPQAAQMGDWPAPFGITLVADTLSAVMVVITGVIALAVAAHATVDVGEAEGAFGYHALFQVLIAGVTGAFLTGDLFNLYVWFEVMLIASFGLLVLGGRRVQLDAGVKYVALNLVSTVLFLTGIGMLYGVTGTLNLADLHRAVAEVDDRLLTVIAGMFLVGFGIKSAMFPLFFWLPASYHAPAFSVSAVFAGLLTKVGVYAMIRMFTLVFTQDTAFTHGLITWAAVATMVTGVLGAAAQTDIRRILSFHIVSQIGYMALGLGLLTPLALAGAVFYLVHHIIVKTNLFLISGVVDRIAGATEIDHVGGLWRGAPLLGLLFLVPAFSLAGFPPLSGFWAKFVLVRAAIEGHLWIIATAALAVGLMTIYSMTKIWGRAFWKPHPTGLVPSLSLMSPGERVARLGPIFGLAAITLAIGVWPEPFLELAMRSAGELLDPTAYVTAVLGAQEP